MPKQIKEQILDLYEKAKFSEKEIEKRSLEKAKMISEEEIRKVKKQLNLEIMENDLLKRSLQDLQDLRKENAELKKKLSISEAYLEIFLDKLQSCNLQQIKKEIKKGRKIKKQKRWESGSNWFHKPKRRNWKEHNCASFCKKFRRKEKSPTVGSKHIQSNNNPMVEKTF